MKEFKKTIDYLTGNLLSDVRQKIGIADDVGRRQDLVMPVIRGTVIAITISLIESLLRKLATKYPNSNLPNNQLVPAIGRLKSYQRRLGLDPSWWGWQELAAFWVMRHYFAHGMTSIAELDQRPQNHLRQFYEDLENGRYQGISKIGNRRKMVIIDRYFSVNNDELILHKEVVNRLRFICCYFLEELEKNNLRLP